MILEISYYTCLGILLMNALRRWGMKVPNDATQPKALHPLATYPVVTLQIPTFNEKHVIRNLLDSIPRIVYPKDKLEIQLLDDSNDETVAIILDCQKKLEAAGYNVSYFHRNHRDGFKSGALNEGLRRAQGDFIAIFDADFLIHPLFFIRLLPHFADSRIAFAQTSWGFTNPEQNILTRMQALLLGSHFEKEKPWRFLKGLFFPFNGTAGIWRRSVIEELGCWPEQCLTEDLALSVSAALKGYHGVYDARVSCPSELPDKFSSLKRQYFRWAKGSAQTLRIYTLRILTSRFTWAYKLDLLSYLSRHFVFVALLLWLSTLPWIVSERTYNSWWNLFDVFILSVTSVCTLRFFKVSKASYDFRLLKNFAVISFIGLSLVPSQTLASFIGLFVQGGTFDRTPKKGASTRGFYRVSASHGLWFEIAFALYYWGCYAFLFLSDFWLSKPLLIWNALALSFFPLNLLWLKIKLKFPSYSSEEDTDDNREINTKRNPPREIPNTLAEIPR